MAPESGNPMIVPICAPLKLNIASLLLSKGGAQTPHIASIAGNVTPYNATKKYNYHIVCTSSLMVLDGHLENTYTTALLKRRGMGRWGEGRENERNDGVERGDGGEGGGDEEEGNAMGRGKGK